MNQLITTSDGSHTIFVPELNEHYHSIHGAVQESNFIFINTGFDFCKADPLNIFEIGFGTGLNALLTATKSLNGERKVNYTSIEKYPVENEIISSLNHHIFVGNDGKEIFNSIHTAPWNRYVNICKNFNLLKIKGDFTVQPLTKKYDLIYFDAFGPDKQPEMWTIEMFKKIADATNISGILVTYSAKGEVRRSLKACGYDVNLLPGPLGKREIIRAIKN
ncbi:MAG TPA: tRNA (5-methylaminomethyl-2-thiouridine)(34)-methyltransferase MnmD [Bacteroidales bacterium]|nr:tRNA (5-methylaminomethyl-2-thiouridine)(34)-methyltransferase MnmD [Bacteroidales bacterium]